MPMFSLALLACTGPSDDTGDPGLAVRAVTFNTGTSEGMGHDDPPDDGYTEAHAATSDTWYGDGLAWLPAVEATRAWLAEVQPDVIGFQEIFHAPECADIPAEHHPDFVCETWTEGDPTVAESVLGDGYQVACHPGHTDKCLGVRTAFATLDDALDGFATDGCGNGARVARGTLTLADGSALTVVNVHGTSGFSSDDEACRVAQVEQVFLDLGDGEPAASGARNLVLGDLNTDPGRFTGTDDSAARWNDFVGEDQDFAWLTEVGPDAPGSYGGLADIDHVASDAFAGDCWIAGVTEGRADVQEARYFDHNPVVCEAREH